MSNALIENLNAIKAEKDTKIIPENIKKDVQIFDIVGTLESGGGTSGVKLFETQEAMQNDSSAKEGDKAVVYRQELQPVDLTSEFRKATFPKTIILSEAITDYIDLSFRAVDESSGYFECYGNLDSSSFYMDCYGESGSYSIQYSSDDGITYTRTKLQGPNGSVSGDSLDFGQEIKYGDPSSWNDSIGKFIKVDGCFFEGFFDYGFETNENYAKYITRINSFDSNKEEYTYTTVDEPINKIRDYIWENCSTIFSPGISTALINKINETEYRVYAQVNSNPGTIYPDFEENCIYIGNNGNKTETYIREYIINLGENPTCELNSLETSIKTYTRGSSTFTMFKKLETYKLFAFYIAGSSISYSNLDTRIIINNNSYEPGIGSVVGGITKYYHAKSQLTINNPNQLLPGCIGYGKELVTGDESLYNNLDRATMLSKFIGIEPNQDMINILGNIPYQEGLITPIIKNTTGKYLFFNFTRPEEHCIRSYYSEDGSVNFKLYEENNNYYLYFTIIKNNQIVFDSRSSYGKDGRTYVSYPIDNHISVTIGKGNVGFGINKYILDVDLNTGTVTELFKSSNLPLSSNEKYSHHRGCSANSNYRYCAIVGRGRLSSSPYNSEWAVYIYDNVLKQGKIVQHSVPNTGSRSLPNMPGIFVTQSHIYIEFAGPGNDYGYHSLYRSEIGSLEFTEYKNHVRTYDVISSDSDSVVTALEDEEYFYKPINGNGTWYRYSKETGEKTTLTNMDVKSLYFDDNFILNDKENIYAVNFESGIPIFTVIDSIYKPSLSPCIKAGAYLNRAIFSTDMSIIDYNSSTKQIKCMVPNVEGGIIIPERYEICTMEDNYDKLLVSYYEKVDSYNRIIYHEL